MKKIVIACAAFLLSGFGYTAIAQEENNRKEEKDTKETEEIIIRKKGEKDANINIQIQGDKVLINGKPLIEFKDDAITINKRKIIVKDGTNIWLNDDLEALANLDNLSVTSGYKKEKSAFLGVTTEKDEKGALVTDVTEESAAAKAGLKEGDIITKIGDMKVDGPETLYKAVTANKPKDEVKVYYIRDGKEKTVKATLQERSQARTYTVSGPGTFRSFTTPGSPRIYSDGFADGFGSTWGGAEPKYNYSFDAFPRQKKLGLRIQDTEEGTGVKVLEVSDSSAAANAGLKKDDVITEIGGVKVTNTDEAREQLMENADKNTYSIKAKRNGTEMDFTIKIPKKLKTANL